MPHPPNYRQLDAQQLIITIEQLEQRIERRFPASGLSGVCRQLLQISREAQSRAAWFSRPILLLRLAIVLLIVLALLVVVVAWGWSGVRFRGLELSVPEAIQAVEAGTNELLVIGAGIFFLVTIERRVKRGRALTAIHELRSIAHIIDMHQLTKDPERLLTRWVVTPESPHPGLSPFLLQRYLDYCSEMLSLTGKVAALYVQNFQDEVALSAVNEVENLTTGLSRKIWQKIMILNDLESNAAAWRGEGQEKRELALPGPVPLRGDGSTGK